MVDKNGEDDDYYINYDEEDEIEHIEQADPHDPIFHQLCEPLIDGIKIQYIHHVLHLKILFNDEVLKFTLNVDTLEVSSEVSTFVTVMLKKMILKLYKQFIQPFTYRKNIKQNLYKLYGLTDSKTSSMDLIYQHAFIDPVFKFQEIRTYDHVLIKKLIRSIESGTNSILPDTISVLLDFPEFFNRSLLELVPEQLFLHGLNFICKNLKAFCPQCNNYLPYALDTFVPCNQEICRYQHSNIALEQNLLDLLKKKQDTVEIIFTMFFNCINSTRMEMNFPTHLKLPTDDPKAILKLFEGIPALSVMLRFKCDHDLRHHLGMELYLLVIWILTSFNLEKESDTILFPKLSEDTCLYRVCQLNVDKIKTFEEIRKNCIERKDLPIIVHHGSKPDCWFNILSNGLQNLSGTKFMTTGSAYGNGIYVSSDVSTARGYSTAFRQDWIHSSRKISNKSLILHLLLLNPKSFDKGSCIYVVPDPDNLLITHISCGN